MIISNLASRTKFLATLLKPNIDEKVFHSNWAKGEGAKSSTWLELKTVVLAVQAFELYLLLVLCYLSFNFKVSRCTEASRIASRMARKYKQKCISEVCSYQK